MLVEGPAVWRLQEVFAEDWFFATNEDLIDDKYFPKIEEKGQELIQVVESGPDQPYETIYTVFFTAIGGAKKYVFVTTPSGEPTRLRRRIRRAHGGDLPRRYLPGRADQRALRRAQIPRPALCRELVPGALARALNTAGARCLDICLPLRAASGRCCCASAKPPGALSPFACRRAGARGGKRSLRRLIPNAPRRNLLPNGFS